MLVAIAWVWNSVASSLFELYAAAAVGGIGAGVIYGASVGNALKWFPDRRGLAAGLTAAGFGASGGFASIEDVKALLAPRAKKLAGAIAGRALYDGRLDSAAALALIRNARAAA